MAKELSDFRQGDTKKIRIFYGTGVDISGYRHWFSLREGFGLPLIAQVTSLVGDHPLDDASNGLAFLQLESDISKLIEPNSYVWDVQRATADNPPDVFTLLPTLKNVDDKIIVHNGVTLVDS